MKQIILLRHAQTTLMDKDSVGYGKNSFDPQLSPLGIKQAKEIGDHFEQNKLSYQIVFTSLYQRTIQTAKELNYLKTSTVPFNGFNEYFVSSTGQDMETTDMAIARTMPKIFSLFDIYDEIAIVGHSSINKTILQALTNITFQEAEQYFNKLGETHIIRYDWQAGDKNWHIESSFIPKQT